jgi:cytochrome c553
MDAQARNNRRWIVASSVTVLALLGIGALLGLLIVPAVQGREAGLDPWTAFCRAVGVKPGVAPVAQPISDAVAAPVSEVAWSSEVLTALVHGDRNAGQALAKERCTACHGERGLSTDTQYPRLSGQSAAALYKQLRDYQTGARAHPMMTAVAQGLDETQVRNLAAYFAHGNSFASLGHPQPLQDYEMDRLVNRGVPDRGIPPCNACHGGGVGGPIETPTLGGQHREYLQRQLQLYASGERRNDVFGRMRNIASRLTPGEIKELAAYYEGWQPVEGELAAGR